MTLEEFMRDVERLGAIVLDAEVKHHCTECGQEMEVRATPSAIELAKRVRAEARSRLGPIDAEKVVEGTHRFGWLEVD